MITFSESQQKIVDELEAVNKKEINEVLEQIRAEIADLEEGISSYHNDRPWVFKDEVLEIIDKHTEGR